MVQFLITDFPQIICDYDYYTIHLLWGNYTSLHCSMLSIRCIKATVPSIRYFNWQNIGLLFHPINWQLMLALNKQGQSKRSDWSGFGWTTIYQGKNNILFCKK